MMKRVLLGFCLVVSALWLGGCCDAIGEKLTEEFKEAESAPGMKELREAGCVSAIKLMGRVQCTTGADSGLECSKLARIFAEAQPERPDEFHLALVEAGDNAKLVCEGIYGPDGTKLREPKLKTEVTERKTTTTIPDDKE